MHNTTQTRKFGSFYLLFFILVLVSIINKKKSMNIKPLGDHILIEPVKEEEKTKTGIFLPETVSKDKSEQGKVIAVGPGKKTDDGKIIMMSVKPGDMVLFQKYGPNEIKIEGKEYLIAREEDILAIIE